MRLKEWFLGVSFE